MSTDYSGASVVTAMSGPTSDRFLDLDLDDKPHPGGTRDYGIGIIGAGFIAREAQMAAHREAGFAMIGVERPEGSPRLKPTRRRLPVPRYGPPA